MSCSCGCSGCVLHIGATPTHYFTFPVGPDELSKVVITYAQDGQIILEKTKDDLEFKERENDDGSKSYVGYFQFTQEESLLFDGRKPKYYMQIKAKTSSDDVIESDVRYYTVERALNKEVI